MLRHSTAGASRTLAKPAGLTSTRPSTYDGSASSATAAPRVTYDDEGQPWMLSPDELDHLRQPARIAGDLVDGPIRARSGRAARAGLRTPRANDRSMS